MKKIYSILFVMLFAVSAKASHIYYTDITYKSLGGLTYEFTLTLYTSCGGAAPPPSLIISVCSPSSGSASSVNLLPVPGTGIPVYPVCSYPLSVCAGGTDIGFLKHVYKTNYTFPSAKSDWTLYHNYCCRNAAITNITSPLSAGVGIKFVIDNLNYPGNSSPTFNDEPVMFACCNQTFSYNQSATDIDGDSLVYSLYHPYTDVLTCSSSANINYSGAFTYLQPITSSPAVSMNSATGYLTMFPTICYEISVIGVEVKEYRAGVLIGNIQRDNVVIVSNQTATVSILETMGDSTIEVFPNPTNSIVTLTGIGKGSTIEVLNVLGEKVFALQNQGSTADLNLSKLENGVYFIKVSSEKGIVSKKIFKE